MSTREKKPPPLGEKALRRFVWRVLSKGLYGGSLPRSRTGTTGTMNWEYLIRTTDLDGKELHIRIAVFPTAGRLKVITRW
jgi:hypothetical protein